MAKHLSTAVVTVTPKLATQWLKLNKKNRPLSPHTVTAYAAQMTSGDWPLTGQAIQFNSTGGLLDGQHRLRAVIESGKSVPMLVVRGVDSAAFDVIDTHKVRNTRDTLALVADERSAGFAAMVAWAARLSLNPTWKLPRAWRLTNRKVHAYWEANKSIHNSLKFGRLARYIVGSEGLAAGLHYLFHKKDSDLADAYILAIAEGESLASDHPAYHVRDRMIKNRISKTKLPRKDVAAMIIKGWNILRSGKHACERQALVWYAKGSNAEDFPKIL